MVFFLEVVLELSVSEADWQLQNFRKKYYSSPKVFRNKASGFYFKKNPKFIFLYWLGLEMGVFIVHGMIYDMYSVIN